MTYQTTLWNFLGTFDPLLDGFSSIIFSLIIWFLLTYPFFRNQKNGFEKSFGIILLTTFIGMILSFFGLAPMLVGLIMVICYILIMKKEGNMDNKQTLILTTKLGTFLSIFSLMHGTIRTMLMLMLIFYFFYLSEKNKKK